MRKVSGRNILVLASILLFSEITFAQRRDIDKKIVIDQSKDSVKNKKTDGKSEKPKKKKKRSTHQTIKF